MGICDSGSQNKLLQSSPFITLYLGSIGMGHVISASCYKNICEPQHGRCKMYIQSHLICYDRALDHLILGQKFCPIPHAKKIFFPNSTKKSQFDPKKNLKKSFFFFFFGGGVSIYIVTYLRFHRIIEYNHNCFFLSLVS